MHTSIGFVGLAVMGENLVLNMERNGFSVVVYNKEPEVVDAFLSGRGKNKRFIGVKTLKGLVLNLDPPRTVMIMIKSGSPVDEVIEGLLEWMQKGDLIIDGGNSNYTDTVRRMILLEEKGIEFIGTGISGGEKGAFEGPSIMPGGSLTAWPKIKNLFQTIAAKGPDGKPCCEWIGSGGAGHYVKMVHNGIEYGDMQIVSEIYWIMKEYLCLSSSEMHDIFSTWNEGKLNSYLVKITSDIFLFKDSDGTPLIDHILDTAGQKGTGKWTAIAGLNEGTSLTLITESVFARSLSAMKENRITASHIFLPIKEPFTGNKTEMIQALHDAMYCAKIISYAQGFELMKNASESHGWNLNFSTIAEIWRGGCIIRSAFLDKISDSYKLEPNLSNLIMASFFKNELIQYEKGWRKTVTAAISNSLPVPALASALCWFDGYKSASLPANLIQAQRDYFGAHTYERTDTPRGQFFHTNWTNSPNSNNLGYNNV